MSKVSLVYITPDAEKSIAYLARVSSPLQDNPNIERLLKYLIDHKHWSPFEMADMCVEIVTSRAIAAQILRHRAFHFQEFSQRYAELSEDSLELSTARRQDKTNRQNSIDDLPEGIKEDWEYTQRRIWEEAYEMYTWAIEAGIAKECARMILPLGTRTKMYMKGTIRDWIHYINLRTANGTQQEHIEIAEKIKAILIKELPCISKAAGWY